MVLKEARGMESMYRVRDWWEEKLDFDIEFWSYCVVIRV